MKKHSLFAFGLMAVVLSCAGCSGKQEPLNGGIIRIAYNQATTHPHYQALLQAGEAFEEATDGRYRFLIYPNEVLGDQRATIELIQNGAIQMAIVNNAMVENYNKDFSVLGLPYVFDSEEHQEKVFTSGILTPLFESTEKEGFQVMAAYTAGSRNIYMEKPVEKPEDLTGRKIRVMESPTMVAMMKYMGGIGTPMSQGEVYTAIQQGVLDGAENNEITYADLKHYEVAPYFSRTRHVMIPDLVIAESAYLDRMSTEDRELLTEILNDSVGVEFDLWGELVNQAIENCKTQGVTFVDVDIKPFQENCMKLHQEAVKDSAFAADLYEQIRKMAE